MPFFGKKGYGADYYNQQSMLIFVLTMNLLGSHWQHCFIDGQNALFFLCHYCLIFSLSLGFCLALLGLTIPLLLSKEVDMIELGIFFLEI